MIHLLKIRAATDADLGAILNIYNEGIEDRNATLESEIKDMNFMMDWYSRHNERYTVLVAEEDETIVGWVSLNPFSTRSAHDGVADLSIYIGRDFRGKGLGWQLLQAIEQKAIENQFYKIVLATFEYNVPGQALYSKCGYRKVGVYEKHGRLDGRPVDVAIMEKILID